jgi:hypothetical protein
MTTFVVQLEAMDLLRILLLVFQQYLEAQQPSLTLPRLMAISLTPFKFMVL